MVLEEKAKANIVTFFIDFTDSLYENKIELEEVTKYIENGINMLKKFKEIFVISNLESIREKESTKKVEFSIFRHRSYAEYLEEESKIYDNGINEVSDFVSNISDDRNKLRVALEKIFLFESYLDRMQTMPEYKLHGVSFRKSWNFIISESDRTKYYFFDATSIGEDCSKSNVYIRKGGSRLNITKKSKRMGSDNLSNAEGGTKSSNTRKHHQGPKRGGYNSACSNEINLLKMNNPLCIMPFDTFDKYSLLIQNKIINNPAIIVTAGTGLGKTTRVPIYLLEILTKPGILNKFLIRNITKQDGLNCAPNWRKSNKLAGLTPDYINEDSTILCALPKNVLVKEQGTSKVILNAVRDAEGRDSDFNNCYDDKKIIGYILKDDNKNAGHYLNFITAGLLNTKFKNDNKLENFKIKDKFGKSHRKNVSCVIIDEAHERTLDIDILLSNLKKVAELKPNFKIVVMSATIKACLFREYFFGEKNEYGNEREALVVCNKTNPKSFEEFNKKHVDMFIPIIHVEKDLSGLENYYLDLGLEIPNVLSEPLLLDEIDSKKSDKVNVIENYLKETTVNISLIAGLLIYFITCIKIHNGIEKYNENIPKNSIGKNIHKLFDKPINHEDIIKKVNDDIIIFVPGKDYAKNIWMILSSYGVFMDYDCFYFESSQVSVLRPFTQDAVKDPSNFKWCNEIIPRKTKPLRWPKNKPAWKNYNFDECGAGLSDNCLSSNDNYDISVTRPQIIIATNVLESSVTFEYCGVVIDCGLENSAGYISNLNMNTLSIQPTVKSSANQRKGRTGRKSDGICYRLYTEYVFDNLLESKPAEILSKNLDFLFIKILDQRLNFLNYDFIESPNYNQINNSLERLKLAEIIPSDFNIYSSVNDLEPKFIEKIQAFNNLNSESSLDFGEENPEKKYFELDLACLDIWYNADNDDLKILMAFFIWVNNWTIDLGDLPSNKTLGDKDSSLIESPVCSLLGLFNDNDFKSYRKIKNKTFEEWIQNFKNINNFKITDTSKDKLNITKDSFTKMNKVLEKFNQKCKFGYIDLFENGNINKKRIYFDTKLSNNLIRIKNIKQENDCYFFSCNYNRDKFNFNFLNVIT